jgi:hypothetical protein
LLLGVVDAYGVMASAAEQRRRELGIRPALGARPVDAFAMTAREGGSPERGSTDIRRFDARAHG